MIKTALKTLLLLFTATTASGQFDYEPKILILSPNQVKYDKSFKKEISDYNKNLKVRIAESNDEEIMNSDEFREQPGNVREMIKSEAEYFKKTDFFMQASMISEQYMAYRFFEKFPDMLIRLMDVKAGDLAGLKSIAEKEKFQYVLNFPSIELYKDKKIGYARISVQLYDNASGSIVLEKDYIGDWSNPGLEFTCNDGSIGCTLNNALSQALGEVVALVASNSPKIKFQKQLEQERTDRLAKYFGAPLDISALKAIIPPPLGNIDLNNVYQAIFSEDKNKFVAFFYEPVPKENSREFREKKNDHNVNIITSEQGFEGLVTLPNSYAYIVKGVKYKEKWYYEKDKATYFDAETPEAAKEQYFDNLQKWDFFMESSIAVNPGFWETKLFAKVLDLTEDPDWKKYGATMWASREVNDRPYIGMYEIVANQLKEQRKAEAAKNEKEIIDKYMVPLVNKLTAKNETVSLKQMSRDYLLLYPSDMTVILCPVKVKEKDKEMVIRYFVLVLQSDGTYKLYEWNYLQQKDFTNGKSGPDLMGQINTLTSWNYSLDTLEDVKFWNEYVLLKSGADYKYLQEMN